MRLGRQKLRGTDLYPQLLEAPRVYPPAPILFPFLELTIDPQTGLAA
jgi:hypothetical protein